MTTTHNLQFILADLYKPEVIFIDLYGILPIVRQPINARGIPSLINILQGIPTDHEGGSYIHVPVP